jgi:hypothetical protein
MGIPRIIHLQYRGFSPISQQSHSLRELIPLLDRALTGTEAEDWVGQVRWLSDWKVGTFGSEDLPANQKTVA